MLQHAAFLLYKHKNTVIQKIHYIFKLLYNLLLFYISNKVNEAHSCYDNYVISKVEVERSNQYDKFTRNFKVGV